jgi:hypothetical protein
MPKPARTKRTAHLKTTIKGALGEPDIRRFDVKAINDSITRSMSALGKDEKVAAIAYYDKSGLKTAVVGRIKSVAGKKIPGKLQWTVMNDFNEDWDWKPSAAVRWSFK